MTAYLLVVLTDHELDRALGRTDGGTGDALLALLLLAVLLLTAQAGTEVATTIQAGGVLAQAS